MNDDISLSELRGIYLNPEYDDKFRPYRAKQTIWLDLYPKKDAHPSPSEIKSIREEALSLIENFYKKDFQYLDRLGLRYYIEDETVEDLSFLRGESECTFVFSIYIDVDKDIDEGDLQFDQYSNYNYDDVQKEFFKHKTLSKLFLDDPVELSVFEIEDDD